MFEEIIIPCLAIIGSYFFSRFTNRKTIYLRNHGIQYTAKIIKISKTGMKAGNRPIMDFVLEYQNQGTNIQLSMTRPFSPFGVPKAGDELRIFVNPENPRDVLVLENDILPKENWPWRRKNAASRS